MALAEARAAWQRTANRCFVQEDAKRAPKLACCPSATQSSKQADTEPTSAIDGQDTAASGFQLHKGNPYSSLSPNSRWWLQSQPYFGYERRITNELLNTSESGMGNTETSVSCTTSKPIGDSQKNQDCYPHCKEARKIEPPTNTCRSGKDHIVGKQEQKTIDLRTAQNSVELNGMSESYELLNMSTSDFAVLKQQKDLSSDLESSWVGIEKSEPWWRVADRDELAFLIAHRSPDLVENCDLPQPKSTHFKNELYGPLFCYNPDFLYASLVEKRGQVCANPDSIVHAQQSQISKTICVEQLKGHSHFGGCRLTSNSTNDTMSEMQAEDDPSKAQLLEALRHSQTRAREAEQAAKQAYEEREHIVKLLFRQASQLFAYKQWFQLWQLEKLYLHINNKSEPISTLFPLLWMLRTSSKRLNSWRKASKRRCTKYDLHTCGICKYALIFAWGLGLIGAGFLLGWTVGWILPIF